MEPKRSMSAYAAAVTAALLLLALAGFAPAAEFSALALLGLAAGLWAERSRLLTNGRADGRPAPPHRRRLDRIVLVQWLGAGVLSFGGALLARHFSWEPMASEGRFLRALLVAFAVGAIGVFVSALVDWAVILPKVSGLSGPAPCECAAGERWKYTTNLWYFHRAAATGLLYLVATGLPTYMAASSSSREAAIWGVVATVIGVLGGYFFRGMFLAGWYAFNPPVLVGDQIYVQAPEEGEGDVRIIRKRAYVLDVSLQGAKYKILEGGRYLAGRFTHKSDGNVPNNRLGTEMKPPRRPGDTPPCAKGNCSGVNWYCRHNPKAHD